MSFHRLLLLAALVFLPGMLLATPSITTSSPLTTGSVGASYAQTLAATGGTGSGYSWSVTAGSLPGGLSLSAAGVLSGTPTAAGTFSFTAQVSDSANATGTKSFSLTIYLVLSANGIGIPSPTDTTTYSVVDNGATVQVPAGMVYVPAGSFTYGPSTTTPVVAATTVTLNGYCIGRFHVTNAELLAFINDTGDTQYIPSTGVTPTAYWVGGTYPAGKGNYPVNFVSLSAAKAYAAWVSAKTGFNVIVPTAYQWEKAARGPNSYTYPWGNTAGANYVNGVLTAKFNFNANVTSYYLTTLNTPYALTPSWTSASTVTFVGGGAVTSGSPYYGNPSQYAVAPYNYYPSPMTVSSIVAISDAATPVATPLSISSTGAVSGYVDHTTDTGFIYTDLFAAINNAGGYTTPVGSYPTGVSGYGAYDMAGNLWSWTTTLFVAANGAEANTTVNEVRGGSWYATATSAVGVDSGEGRADGDYNSVGFRIAMILPGNGTGLSVSTASLGDGVNGVAYSQSLVATGGTSPYNWSVSSGALPTVLSLSPGGVLSGTPTATGSYTFTVQVGDSGGRSATQSLSLTVANPLAITSASPLASGAVGVAYSQPLTASGGAAPYTWSLSSGALPGGLSLSSAGVLSGTPTATGSFSFSAQVSDSSNNVATQSFSLTVTVYTPLDHFNWDTTPTSANAGTIFPVQLTARDSSGALVSTYNGAVNLTAATATGSSTLSPIVVTEVAPGSERQFEIQNVSNTTINTSGWFVRINDTTNTTSPAVSDMNSMNATTLSLPSSMAAGQILLVTASSTDTANGRVYFGSSIAWSNVPGKRYGWVGIFDASSKLRDIFMWGWTSAYTAQFNVTVNGQAITLSNQWTGAGATSTTGAPGAVTVDSFQRAGSADSNTTADWSWHHNSDNSNATSLGVTNTGLTIPFANTGSTALTVVPASVTLINGSFSGNLTISQAATNVTLTAADTTAHSGLSSPFTVGAELPLSITSASPLAGGAVGVAYSQTLAATGGMNPYTWSVTAGVLPAGLSLSAAGVLSGTPIAAGAFGFTIQAADTSSAMITKAVLLTIITPLSITGSSTLAAGTVGLAYSEILGAAGGTAPYTWTVNAGTLPTGLTLSGTGVLAGTPTATGAFSFTLQVADSGGLIATAALTVTVNTPFTAWLSNLLTAAELANPNFSGPLANPSGDGIPNLIKYALNLDPLVPTARATLSPTIVTDSGNTYLTVSYTQLIASSGITYYVDISPDLNTWYTGSQFTQQTGVVDDGNGITQTVTVRILASTNLNSQIFTRLRVSQP